MEIRGIIILGGVFFSFLITTVTTAQTKPPHEFSIGLNYYGGGLMGRYNAIHTSIFLPEIPTAFEVVLNKVTNGRQAWHKHWRYPVVGLAITYFDYHTTDPVGDLGKTIALTPFIEQYIFRTKYVSFSIAPGLGIGYHTKIYDPETNFRNTAISTPLTASFLANFKLLFHLSKSVDLQAIYSLRHFSNGAVQLPNPGTNFMLWGLGVTWNPKPYQADFSKDTTRGYDRKFHLNVEVSANKKSIRSGESFRYTIFSVGAYLSRRVSKINTILVGLDGYYDESIRYEYRFHNREQSVDIDTSAAKNVQLVVYAGTEIFAGRFSYSPTFGIHLIDGSSYAKLYGSWLVHRHTFRYYVQPNFYFKGALKVYSFAADSFEVGLGFRL